MALRTRSLIAALIPPALTAATIGFTLMVVSPLDPAWIGSAGFLIYFWSSGRWDIISNRLRWPLWFLFTAATAMHLGPMPALAAVMLWAEFWLVVRRGPPAAQCLALRFPLAGGCYYVAHGGATSITNYHRTASQRFAVDITALDQLGRRATRLMPSDNSEFVIYRQPVLSPCDGVVSCVRDGLPDWRPFDMHAEHVAGNHVLIDLGDGVYVGLAHLLSGSVTVGAGSRISAGQVIGAVGNSGHTSEPHLHLHAKRGGKPEQMFDGVAVPMRFDGRWLIRNDVVTR